MRRNVIAGALLVLGLALIGGAMGGLGVFGSQSGRLPNTASLGAAPPGHPEELAGVASSAGPALPNSAVALLSIPSLGLHNVPVYDRGLDAKGNMAIAHGFAVTHFEYSAAIGGGNAVLYGHDDIEGSVFRRLSELKAGDEVDLMVAGQTSPAVYRVSGRRIVAATAVQILNPTGDIRLTLFTCWPTWVDTQRVVVTATPAA
jgi:LPXTG-site transpeptidase (sortase) family protein